MDDGLARAARTVDAVPAAGNSLQPSLPSLDELRAGDEAAYEKLVSAFSPWMRRVARKHVHSAGLAEDIVQETWLAVLRELDTFQGRSSLKTWIFQILVNQAKSAGRRERRVIAVDQLHHCIDRPGTAVGWPCLGTAAPVARPEDLVVADEAARAILAAIATLPPRDAQIIALRDIQGLSAPEAAEQLGISAGNQRVLLHRARVRLRALLRPCTDDQSGRETSEPFRPAGSSSTFRRSKTPPAISLLSPTQPCQRRWRAAARVSERVDTCPNSPKVSRDDATFHGPASLFPVEHRWLDFGSARIHYVDEGTGDTLLLHGNPSWSFRYRKIITRLKDDYRGVAPDHPGYGLSEAPAGYRYTPAGTRPLPRAARRHSGASPG